LVISLFCEHFKIEVVPFGSVPFRRLVIVSTPLGVGGGGLWQKRHWLGLKPNKGSTTGTTRQWPTVNSQPSGSTHSSTHLLTLGQEETSSPSQHHHHHHRHSHQHHHHRNRHYSLDGQTTKINKHVCKGCKKLQLTNWLASLAVSRLFSMSCQHDTFSGIRSTVVLENKSWGFRNVLRVQFNLSTSCFSLFFILKLSKLTNAQIGKQVKNKHESYNIISINICV